MEKFRYWILYRDAEERGYTFETLPSALDTDEKIIALHRRLEERFGKRVIVEDWKRID